MKLLMTEETQERIKVRYLYSACIKTSTPDVEILHDPWFTDGIYDGSWFQFPKPTDPLKLVGDCDLVYISHIHPDHYDPFFLKEFFSEYGTKPVLIAQHNPNHLLKKMRADGIDATVVSEPLSIGRTTIKVIPHLTGSVSDVDSALILHYMDGEDRLHCVVNANDIIFDEQMKTAVKSASGEIDILCCGYTGAGPYPQTYFEPDDPDLLLEAEKKKQKFFDRYRDLVNFMGAKNNLPFAGKYILGGKLSALNSFRGVADPIEILAFDNKAVVLADFGGEIDTYSRQPTKTRTQAYDTSLFRQRIHEISSKEMDYERLISANEIGQLPLKRLLSTAVRNAISKSECEEDYFFCLPVSISEFAVINANRNLPPNVSYTFEPNEFPFPRSVIQIDPRYLFGLLVGIYHWNNAEVGSQYQVRRSPNSYQKTAQEFLNFLCI